VFGNDQPVEVEVGCGRGVFLVAAASANPERNFFGLECAGRLVDGAQAAIEKAGLRNARVLGCDARCVIKHLIGPRTVAAYHIYFPDPWWKRRHYKRRIYVGSFAEDLARTLVPDGRVYVATDVTELMTAITRRFAEAKLESRSRSHGDLPTRFAQRCVGVGRTVHQLTFARC
jgi:tRNA (guanine-N7-)-methyltransferase